MPGNLTVLEGVLAPDADLLNAVAVKLPLFWPENIETWFVHTESQFRLHGVMSSQTKFDFCVQQEVTVKVLDLIRNPPADNPYQHLKDRLLQVAPHVCPLGLCMCRSYCQPTPDQ